MINTPYDLIPYILLIAMFSAGTWYHGRIYQSHTYYARLTKPMKAVITLIPVILIGMAYFVGEKSLYKYLLSIMASLFLISQPIAQGMSEKGLYYISPGSGMLLRLAKWEHIKEIKIDSEKNKLKSFIHKKRKVYPAQIYDPKDLKEIKRYISTKVEDYIFHE